MPDDLARFRLPPAVNKRLHTLLDRQDTAAQLTAAERKEAEGLVKLAELPSLLQLRLDGLEDGRRRGERDSRQRRPDHFCWEGVRAAGMRPTGRATVAALRMNRPLILAIR
jgi:hypothetical protein